MRKAYLFRDREKSFDISFHVNDKPLPIYNALKDPYLQGFFDKPPVKKHLQQIGMRKKKKRSHSHYKRPKTTSKNMRFDKETDKQIDIKLPALEQGLINNQIRQIKTAGSSKRKKRSLYHSKKASDLF